MAILKPFKKFAALGKTAGVARLLPPRFGCGYAALGLRVFVVKKTYAGSAASTC
jgi:hypothetical protein